MIFYVQIIDNFYDIQPYVAKIAWQWEWLSGHLKVVKVAHIVITDYDILPFVTSTVAKCCHQPR